MKSHFILVTLLIVCCFSCAPTRRTLEMERIQQGETDLEWLDANPPDLSHPLSLEEAISIAVSRNLELYIKEQEYQIREEQATKVRFALLPQLNFNFVDSRRSNSPASSSIFEDPTLNNGNPIFQVSSKRHMQNWDFGFLWNVLDFGVTYFHARQAADEGVKETYEYDRIRNSVVLRVVASYWRAVSAWKALDRANSLLPEMQNQTDKLLKEIESKAYLTKDQALEKVAFFYQREVQVRGFNDRNDSSDPTQGYGKEYEVAMLDLATLLQLPPGADFEIVIPDGNLPYKIDLPDVKELFVSALANRPELYSKDLDYKINADNVVIAMIQTFPGLSLFNLQNWNSNPFLLHKRWFDAGFRITWNLLALPQNFMDQAIGKDVLERDLRERLSLSEGILTQVAVAYLQYAQNVEQYELALKVAKANDAIAELDTLESRVGKKSKLEALQSRINAALAYNNVGKIYAELQTNLEQLNNAIGLPRFFSIEDNARGLSYVPMLMAAEDEANP